MLLRWDWILVTSCISWIEFELSIITKTIEPIEVFIGFGFIWVLSPADNGSINIGVTFYPIDSLESSPMKCRSSYTQALPLPHPYKTNHTHTHTYWKIESRTDMCIQYAFIGLGANLLLLWCRIKFPFDRRILQSIWILCGYWMWIQSIWSNVLCACACTCICVLWVYGWECLVLQWVLKAIESVRGGSIPCILTRQYIQFRHF